jgi:hypothetical protein
VEAVRNNNPYTVVLLSGDERKMGLQARYPLIDPDTITVAVM